MTLLRNILHCRIPFAHLFAMEKVLTFQFDFFSLYNVLAIYSMHENNEQNLGNAEVRDRKQTCVKYSFTCVTSICVCVYVSIDLFVLHEYVHNR